MAVAQNDTNLGGSGALPGELADLVNDLLGGGLEPRGRAAGVGDGGGRNALALAVEATVRVSRCGCSRIRERTPFCCCRGAGVVEVALVKMILGGRREKVCGSRDIA